MLVSGVRGAAFFVEPGPAEERGVRERGERHQLQSGTSTRTG